MLQGLVFDFDGTIIDSETPEFEAARAVWRHHGLELDQDFWEAKIGSAGYNWLAHLAEHAGPEFDARNAERRRFEIHRTLIEQTGPNPGVVDLMNEARAAGLGVAVATNAPREWPEHHLERVGIRGLIDYIVSVDDVPRGKPFPDPYLRACELIEAKPGRCVAFEDSAIGVISAATAGLYVVAVPHHLSASHDVSPADIVLDTLEGLTLDHLHTAIAARA